MAGNEQMDSERRRRPASDGERRPATGSARSGSSSPGRPANTSSARGQEVSTAREGDSAALGLDEARHRANQLAAEQADYMRESLFPALMADALGYRSLFGNGAYKVYLQRLMDDAGNPADPVERMMIEQLALAHFRIGQLQLGAGGAKSTEAIKILNSAAARLLGEFRRTALALRAYRVRQPEARNEKNLKLFKAAQ